MTDVVTQYKEHLRAMFNGNTDQAQRILESMGDGPWEGTGRFNLAVFGLAARKRFSDDKSHEAVMTFVRDADRAWASAEESPNPLHVELLTRAALGETDLFDAVPSEARNVILPVAAYAMISDINLSSTEIDELLDQAEQAIG